MINSYGEVLCMKKIISVIAPMYNENSLVHEYCKEVISIINLLDNYLLEIVLVNDGSKDNTYELMIEEQKKYPNNITVVNLSRNFGLEGAVNAGLKVASGDAVVVMDADLQDPPALIPEMIKRWEEGAEVVVCSRIKRSNDGFFKKLGAGVYYKVLDSLSGKLKLEKSAANFRLLSRKALKQINSMPEVNSVFRVVVPFIGMKTSVIGYDRDKRFAGETKYNLKKMIPYALDSITGISVEPLRKIMYMIPLMILISISCLMISFFIEDIFKAAFVIMFFIGGCFSLLLVCVYIIAEYIAQIMIEVKGRPMSIIYEYIPSNYVKESGKAWNLLD